MHLHTHSVWRFSTELHITLAKYVYAYPLKSNPKPKPSYLMEIEIWGIFKWKLLLESNNISSSWDPAKRQDFSPSCPFRISFPLPPLLFSLFLSLWRVSVVQGPVWAMNKSLLQQHPTQTRTHMHTHTHTQVSISPLCLWSLQSCSKSCCPWKWGLTPPPRSPYPYGACIINTIINKLIITIIYKDI